LNISDLSSGHDGAKAGQRKLVHHHDEPGAFATRTGGL
jgi:hypothetical protein